jgi:hypothetical protein
MQDASVDFAAAVEASVVLWCRPLLLADWLADGYTELSSMTGRRPGYVVERFRRPSSSSTWLRPGIGQNAYVHVTGANTEYTVESGLYGRHGTVASATRNSFIQTGSSNMYGRMRFNFSATPTGSGEITVGLVLRGDGTGVNHYEARAEFDIANSTIDIKLIERDAGTSTAIETTNDFATYVAGHTYVLVAQLNDEAELGLSRMKFYDEDIEEEPIEWALSHDVTPVNYGSYGGVRTVTPSGQTNAAPFYINVLELRLLDGSIDDLSDLHGQVTVTQTMDDGLPDEVSFVTDLGTALFNAQLVGGRRGMRPTQYLSPFNQDSPLYGLERDVAGIRYEHGVITAAGPERVRLFTGQMVDIPVAKDRIGHLQGMSSTRLKLSKLIQPPPFNLAGDLSANWLVTFAAYQCGVYAAPNPRDSEIMYAPLHGSLQPLRAFDFPDIATYRGIFSVIEAAYLLDTGTGAFSFPLYDVPTVAEAQIPPYVPGPYVAAPDTQFTASKALGIYYNSLSEDFPPDGGTGDTLSQAGPRGWFEFCVRGDAFNSTAPSGSTLTPATFILGFLLLSNSTSTKVYLGINMSRQLRIEMSDGTAAINANAAAAFDLPTDGAWYKYGVAWDFVTETAYFYRRDPDGTEHTATSTNAALDVTRLPATDDFFGVVQPFNSVITTFSGSQTFSPWFHSFLPCAELHWTSGTDANPNNAPWIWSDDYGFEPSAIFGLSSHRLRAVAEPVEREAWEYITELAQAEMAVTRIDELDRAMYLPVEYWAREAQQTEVGALDTLTNVSEMVPQVDPSKIRNSIRVSYGETRIDRLHQPLFSSRDVVAIPPGTQTLLIVLDELATSIDTSGATLPTQTQITNGVANFVDSSNWKTFFTFNTSPTAAGTVYSNGGSPNPTSDPVYAQVDDLFGANFVTVTIFNRTGGTIYTANNNVEVPTISIAGLAMRRNDSSASASRDSSISRRGFRGLAVDAPVIQRLEDAQRLATRLLGELSEPVATLEDVKLFGDQRRQPGDMVTFADSRDTGVDGLWRLLRVNHVIDGANYTQDVRLKPAKEVGVWGTSRWGQSLWGREGL